MDQRAIIDVICKAGLETLPGEVGALLGQELSISDIHVELTTKTQLFSDLAREKTALTQMDVTGDREGQSYLLTRLSCAAILAGTLIMLPEDMIEENAQNGTLDGELADSFGEVANIVAGVFTQVFVDKYSKSLRFIKKEVNELVPTKIDAASDDPFPPGNYYVASGQLTMGEKNLGPLELVVPAAVFDLEEEEAEVPAEQPAAGAAEAPSVAPAADLAQDAAAQQAAAPPSEPAPAPAAPKPSFADAKKVADVVFNATVEQAGEEVGALLGQTLSCDDIKLVMTSKADFFSNHCIDKSVMTRMKVTGDKEGLGFMLVQVPDAVVMGGTLIMLPEDEIASQRTSGILEGEVEDAFGEIANIISGSLTQVFLDRYPQKLRFIKAESDIVVPTKVLPDSDEPFAEDSYYLASFAIHMEGQELNRIQLIFPGEIFNLDEVVPQQQEGTASAAAGDPALATAADGPAPGEWGGAPLPSTSQPAAEATTSPATETQAGAAAAAQQAGGAPASSTAATAQTAAAAPAGPPTILIISDEEESAASVSAILKTSGFSSQILAFQDDIKGTCRQVQVIGAVLIMTKVDEKGFAAAIKLHAAMRPLPPMIFAGPEWTKTAVLKAIKYGARDILITPAKNDEIQDKISIHFKQAEAAAV